jgi:hypothetical protein
MNKKNILPLKIQFIVSFFLKIKLSIYFINHGKHMYIQNMFGNTMQTSFPQILNFIFAKKYFFMFLDHFGVLILKIIFILKNILIYF